MEKESEIKANEALAFHAAPFLFCLTGVLTCEVWLLFVDREDFVFSLYSFAIGCFLGGGIGFMCFLIQYLELHSDARLPK